MHAAEKVTDCANAASYSHSAAGVETTPSNYQYNLDTVPC